MSPALAVAIGLSLITAAPGAPPEAPDARLGTRIQFHGWSPDGQRLAYTRHERRPPSKRGRPVRERVRRLHRKVTAGEFAGVLRTPHLDGDLGAWAQRNGFVVEPLEVTPLDERRYWFIAPEGVYELLLDVGDVLAWELRFEGALIHRHEFDTVYVGWQPALYLAPGRGHVAVVIELDAGWVVDAGIWPVELPERIRDRWRLLTEPGTSPPEDEGLTGEEVRSESAAGGSHED